MNLKVDLFHVCYQVLWIQCKFIFPLFCGIKAISESHDSNDFHVQGPDAVVVVARSDLDAFPGD